MSSTTIRGIEHYWELDGSTGEDRDEPPCYFTRMQAQNQGRCRAVIERRGGEYTVSVRVSRSVISNHGFAFVCALPDNTLDEAKVIAERAVMLGLDTYEASSEAP